MNATYNFCVAILSLATIVSLVLALLMALFDRRFNTETARTEALRQSEERLRCLVQNASDIIGIVDAKGIVNYLSESITFILGYEPKDWIGNSLAALVHPNDSSEIEAILEQVHLHPATLLTTACRIQHVDGTWRDFEIVCNNLLEQPSVAGIVITYHDVTVAQRREIERQQSETALRESEERYALAVRAANDGLWDWNLKTNAVYFSSRWKSMLGYKDSEIGNSLDDWFDRVHPDDLDRVKLELLLHLQGITPHFENEHRMRHCDTSYRWMLSRGVAARDASGSVYRLAGSQTDITERKAIEAQLLHDACHDALTGLPNRVLFQDRLAHAVEVAKRHKESLFSVIFLDFDRFKVINDSLGHLVGDQLLIAIARRLENCIRHQDTIARLGGDEFAILLEDIQDINDATAIANRIQRALVNPFLLNQQEIVMTVSMGIALGSSEYEHIEDVLRDADTALYRAKVLGKAQYAVFDPTMHTQAVTLLQREHELRRAISMCQVNNSFINISLTNNQLTNNQLINNQLINEQLINHQIINKPLGNEQSFSEHQQLQVHYQPIVSLDNRTILGFEALVRWQHPEDGLVFPSEFIPIAEETGLIVPMGYWVLYESCQQLRLWQECFSATSPLEISVNFSAKQLIQPDLIEKIEQVLQQTHLNPRCLRIEITESSILKQPELGISILKQLKERGIQLAIDDFGTGYSSLSYLHRLPIDTLKIDRSFIHRMDVERDQWELVRTILALAENLGLSVVAEGVETPEELAQLEALGCKAAQGYLFSKAIDCHLATTLLRGQI